MAGPELKYPSIPEFFSGRSVFITGSTGFMGKILVEKLLRSCPGVGTLYLLMRAKRGHQPNARLDELVAGPIFDKLREENPNVLSKLRVVSGDVTEEGLGIKDEVREEMCANVSVVFHCAACVRFDQKLRYAVQFNTMGTKRVLALCRNIDNLESMVYVSTCYCHCDREVLDEQPYDPPCDPERIIDTLEWMNDDLLETITPTLLGGLPNTYAFSKCLSEKLVTDASKFMPVAIARPSIVTPAYREPMPGYVDNLNGPTGLLLGAGKGVLRSMHCHAKFGADLIPVDIACNGLIAVAWSLANTRPTSGPLVVNLTCSRENQISWEDVIGLGRKHIYSNPFTGVIWFPDGSIKNSKLSHELCVILFHNIPAYVIDCIAVLCRKKPFMVNVQKRLQGGLELLQYYTTKQWNFTTLRMTNISARMRTEDRLEFNTDVKDIDWDLYMKMVILGTRKYILKDDPSTLPKARRQLKRLYYLDRGVRALFYLMLLWFVFSNYETASRLLDGATWTFEQVTRTATTSAIAGTGSDDFPASPVTS